MNQKELLEYRFKENKCFLCGKESIGSVTLTGPNAKGNHKNNHSNQKTSPSRLKRNNTSPNPEKRRRNPWVENSNRTM